jgi:nitrate/TMAO reductase-like tetraheme cytochrome c subunit
MRFRLTTRGLTIAAILLTVVVVGIGVALAATSTPQFCGSCKSHVPYVDEWRRSAHDGVNCEQCHSKPGPFFFLTAKLEALQQPIAQVTGDYEKPILG